MVTEIPIQFGREEKRIQAFIRKVVGHSGTRGAVVGLSGGVDSALVGALCVGALGPRKVVAAILPSENTPAGDIKDAEDLAGKWRVKVFKADISPIVASLVSAVPLRMNRIARGNIQARARMTILYGIANGMNLLVAGTGDRSELSLGFFTKWGDGGTDFMPIAHLYKTQVRALGKFLRLPENVVNKPASPQLWPGHTAADELPADYREIDRVLYLIQDRKLSRGAAASMAGVESRVINKILRMNRRSAHKRALPPSLIRGSQEIRFMPAKD